MKSLKRQAGFCALTAGKTAIAFAIMAAMSMVSIPPAFAEHGGGEGRHGEHDGGGWRGDHDRRGWRGEGGYGGGYAYPQPYQYAQPVYVPPPVYYPPQISPGINLMFPLNFRIR